MRLRGFRTAAEGDELGDKIEGPQHHARQQVQGQVARDPPEPAVGGSVRDGHPAESTAWHPDHHAEDPRETITAHDAATGETLAALKLFRDDWDYSDVAHMYIRQATARSSTTRSAREQDDGRVTTARRGSSAAGSSPRASAKLPRFPIIRFPNRGGRGEYEYHLDTIDRINDEIMDKLVIAKVQAFRQMAVKNLPDNRDQDRRRKAVERSRSTTPTRSRRPRVAVAAAEGRGDVGVHPTDLGPLRLAIKDDLQDLAGATRRRCRR
jgi:hypothetical protein